MIYGESMRLSFAYKFQGSYQNKLSRISLSMRSIISMNVMKFEKNYE